MGIWLTAAAGIEFTRDVSPHELNEADRDELLRACPIVVFNIGCCPAVVVYLPPSPLGTVRCLLVGNMVLVLYPSEYDCRFDE